VHAVVSFETSPTTRKSPQFVDFDEKKTVISFAMEIFGRLNVQITAFDAQNIVHDLLSLETSPTIRKMRPFVDYVEKWV
jgi:hypothetical protein